MSMNLDNENVPADNPIQPAHVLVGEGEKPVPVALIQQIFNELTGKTEANTESFTKPYRIVFSDIENLCQKIQQTLVQYSVLSVNFSAVIYYANNSKEELSSFDRLAFHSTSSTGLVESIIFLKSDFLIVPPQVGKSQSYTINIRIASGIAIRRRIREDRLFIGAPPTIIRLMGNRSAYSKIEYIDYSIARNFQGVIREWFSVLPHGEQTKVIDLLQGWSHHIPRAFQCFAVLLSSSYCYIEAGRLIPNHNGDLAFLTQFGIITFSLVYFSSRFSGWLGEFVEHAVDSWSPLSYIQFTKGDELEITKYKSMNRRSILKACGGVASAILLSALTKVAASVLLGFVGH